MRDVVTKWRRLSFAGHKPRRLILGMRLANEGRRYKVTPSLVGWAQTQNQPYNSSEWCPGGHYCEFILVPYLFTNLTAIRCRK